MNRKPKPEMIDAENPEWTEEDFATAVPFSELPDSLRTVLASRRRGPQKAPTKQQVSLRLSADVIAYFKEGEVAGKRALIRCLRNTSANIAAISGGPTNAGRVDNVPRRRVDP